MAEVNGKPDACPSGHALTWVTPLVAVCACRRNHIWRLHEKTGRLRVETNQLARELADMLSAGSRPALAQQSREQGDTVMVAQTGSGFVQVGRDSIVERYGRDNGSTEGVSVAQLKAVQSLDADDERHAAECRRQYDDLLRRTEGYRVAMAALRIDPTYQREIESAHVARMRRTFNPLWVGTLSVSLRGDGEMYVLDGQQRLQVFKELGFGDRPVDAKVWLDLSPAEEAQVFLGLNSSKTINAANKLRARKAAGYPDAKELSDAITEAGFEVDYHNGAKAYELAAVTAVEAVYDAAGGLEHGGFLRTKAALILYRKLWNGRRSYESALIRAAGAFTIRHFGNVKVDQLVRRFQPDKTALKTGLPWSPQVLVSEGAAKFDKQPAAGAAFLMAQEHDRITGVVGKVAFKPEGPAIYLLPEVKRARARGEC